MKTLLSKRVLVWVIFWFGKQMEVDLHDVLAHIRFSEGGFHFRVEEGVKGDIILNETVLHLPIALLLLPEALRMEVVQQLVSRYHKVDQGDNQADHRPPGPLFSDHGIEDDLSCAAHDEGSIE